MIKKAAVFFICFVFLLAGCSQQTLHTISFDTNDGSEVSQIIQQKGDAVNEPNDPSKDGFYFIGWFYDQELTDLVRWPLVLSKDFELFAKWRAVGGYPQQKGERVDSIDQWNLIFDNSSALLSQKSKATLLSFNDTIIEYVDQGYFTKGIINDTEYQDWFEFNDAHYLASAVSGYLESGRLDEYSGFVFEDFSYSESDGYYVATDASSDVYVENSIIEVYYKIVDGLVDEYGWWFDFDGVHKFSVKIEYGAAVPIVGVGSLVD